MYTYGIRLQSLANSIGIFHCFKELYPNIKGKELVMWSLGTVWGICDLKGSKIPFFSNLVVKYSCQYLQVVILP